MFEEGGDEQSVLGSGPESPAADDAGDDEEVAADIASIECEYRPLYNPGGPGPEPFPEVRYTEPSPHDLEPVIIALDDPLRVSNVP